MIATIATLSLLLAQQGTEQQTAAQQRFQPMPPPRTMILQRGDRRIAIDGSLQDWPALPPVLLDDPRQISGTALGAWRGRDDLAARLFLMWDEQALYVSANVRDDWHLKLKDDSQASFEVPPADSLLVTVDPGRDTRSWGNDPGRQDDVEFWLAEVEGQGKQVVRWNRFRGEARFSESAEAVIRYDEERRQTYYEARLPWEDILPHGEVAKAGRVFDLQFVVSDYDEPTDPLPQTRAGWTFGMGPRIDPAMLGTAILVGFGVERLTSGPLPKIEIHRPPELGSPAVPPEEYWVELWEELRSTEPEIVDRETVDPQFAGGEERHAALTTLDQQCGEFPRVDLLEFVSRVHRRMRRESAGIAASGLPLFWDLALGRTMRAIANRPLPEQGYELIRLPQGGWLVRSKQASFAIDPVGRDVESELAELIDFVVLTEPLDPSRRNDQLLVRLRKADPARPVLTHISFHLPLVSAEELPLVRAGESYQLNGLDIKVFGLGDLEGRVSASAGYRITWPDGADLLISGRDLDENQVDRSKPPACLLLSAMDPRAHIVGQRLRPGLIVLDDVLQCRRFAGEQGRVSLAEACELQEKLLPQRSLILAPGEQMSPRGL